MNDIPNPTGVEAFIRLMSDRIDPDERTKITVLENYSISMARLLLKKARDLMNIHGPGHTPAINSFDHVFYTFVTSFGELCSRVRPDPEEVRRMAKDAEMAANREKKAEKNNPADTALVCAVREGMSKHKPATRSIEYAQRIRPFVLERLKPLKLTKKDGGRKRDDWPGDWTIKGVVTKELDRVEGKTAVLPDK